MVEEVDGLQELIPSLHSPFKVGTYDGDIKSLGFFDAQSEGIGGTSRWTAFFSIKIDHFPHLGEVL